MCGLVTGIDELSSEFSVVEFGAIFWIEFMQFARDFAEGIEGAIDGGGQVIDVAAREFLAFLIEGNKSLHLIAQHLDFAVVFFVVGSNENHHALAFLGELAGDVVMLGEWIDPFVGVLDALFVAFESGL